MAWEKRYRNMEKELEYAWAAGFIDGEGCIRVSRFVVSPTYTSHNLRLQVGVCHLESLERLKGIFGVGGIYLAAQRSAKQNEAYTWVVTGLDAIAVIKHIMPFLVTKRVEAQVALRMEPLLGFTYKFRQRVDPEIVRQREEICKELRDLKQRTRFRH